VTTVGKLTGIKRLGVFSGSFAAPHDGWHCACCTARTPIWSASVKTRIKACRAIRSIVVAGIAAFVIPAHASVIFTLGNTGGFSTINLDQSSGGSTTVTGTLNPVPQGSPSVSFSSSELLDVPSGGQARIEASTGLINELTISIPGQTFEGFVLNPFGPAENGDIVVSVNTSDGVFVYDTSTYGSINGNNFLTITTDSLESILSISLSSAGGFADLRQPRILLSDGGGGFTPAEISEPGLLMLLGVSLGAAALARRRKARGRNDVERCSALPASLR